MALRRALLVALVALPLPVIFAAGCTSDASSSTAAADGTVAAFDLNADFTSPDAFYSFPYPSDLRLGANGAPIGDSFPNPKNKPVLRTVKAAIDQHPGFPLVPVGYFTFSAPMPALDENDTIAADVASPILLVDVDPKSPTRGQLIPTAATILPWDAYIAESDEVPTRVLAVSARAGFILEGNHTYAFVVRTSLKDAAGKALATPPVLTALLEGQSPGGDRGAAAVANYAPLASTLKDVLKIPASEIAAATVFTTGDVVSALADLGTKVVAKYDLTIDNLTLDATESTKNDRVCILQGSINFPAFQKGTPPYDTDGLFETGSDGVPVEQRRERAPVVISIPKQPMPAGGYPLTMYFHGSGGVSRALIDRGAWKPMDQSSCAEFDRGDWENVLGCFETGKGPAWVYAPEGIAMAGTALNVNPERLPGADPYAYANIKNLAAVRDTFRQGVIEQRLFLEALGKLRIPASALAGCAGVALPTGETDYRFKDGTISVQGQSMGGMYSNMFGATEPRVGAVVPTGAGGYWSYMFMRTTVFGANTRGLIATLIDANGKLSYMHPAMHAVETAIESADPIVFTPRLAKNPLPNHPVRSIYAPAGKDDSYFPMAVFDAMAIAYGSPQAGSQVWPAMQTGLELVGLDGLRSYPLLDNLTSSDSSKYTGAIVQYEGDGIFDPHALYSQLPAVKHQSRCFHGSFHKTKKPVIVAPGDVSDACP